MIADQRKILFIFSIIQMLYKEFKWKNINKCDV